VRYKMKSQETPLLRGRREFLRQTALGFSTAVAGAPMLQGGPPGAIREIREESPKLKIGVFDAAFPDDRATPILRYYC
jgi:hypothetical protein